MNKQFLDFYNTELHHLRHQCLEFADANPKIAGRLHIRDRDFEYVDPYVERLLEGFAYMAARVQVKLHAEFPRFSQALLSTVYPHYLAPTPSIAIAQFTPNYAIADLQDGVPLPRGTLLRSQIVPHSTTACQFHTAHDVTLWPVTIANAQYVTRSLATLNLPEEIRGRAGLSLRFATAAGQPFSELNIEHLDVHLRGFDESPYRMWQQLFANCTSVVIKHVSGRRPPLAVLKPSEAIAQLGFRDEEAVLPVDPRVYSGYRLLQEYFAMPQRFLFVRLQQLKAAIAQCDEAELEIVCVFDQADHRLEKDIDTDNFALYCTPIVNLFSKRADRINLSDRFSEHRVVVDRTRPTDYEVYSIESVTGYDLRNQVARKFQPFYAMQSQADNAAGQEAYFVVNRVKRTMTEKETQAGSRSRYTGSEVYVGLVDAESSPFHSELHQLGLNVMCTNRDLPMRLNWQNPNSCILYPDTEYPIDEVRCIHGPTAPRASWAEGEFTWRLISSLSLNYLSIANTRGGDAPAALQALLRLFCDSESPSHARQLEGIATIGSEPIMRRVTTPGAISFARGLLVTVTFEEAAFTGMGPFLLGAVLDNFFSGYVSVNSFTETSIRTVEHGELIRWPAKIGHQPLL